MRILHTESSKGWGGQENRTINEMIGLRELGHEPAVLAQPGARILARATENGFPTFSVKMRGAIDVPALLQIRRIIGQFRADVVNTHSGKDTQLAGLAARSLGGKRPLVVRTRHLALPITSRFTYSTLPDHVVAVSRFVGDYLAAAGVPRDRITAVPTGVDFSRYHATPEGGSLRQELGLPPKTRLIGTIAILRRKKGHLELIQAIPAVLQRHPDVHFAFAGDGPIESVVKKAVIDAGLEAQVHFLGLRRDIVNILQSLDLFVLPTHQEALGTAFIEAAAMGLPVVATRVDGVPEVVADGETGLLVPVLNTAALAQAICTLLDSPERCRAMGQRASLRIRQIYSREAMATGMAALYLRLLEAQ